MSSFLDEYSSGNDDGDENFASCEEASKAHLTDLQTDTADAESGVEPDSNEWIFQDIGESVEFDITAEQAMATLRYFSEFFAFCYLHKYLGIYVLSQTK